MTNFFDSIAGASLDSRYPKLPCFAPPDPPKPREPLGGMYAVRFERILIKASAQRPGEMRMIGEFEVLQSTRAGLTIGRVDPGDHRSWTQNLGVHQAAGAILELLAALFGFGRDATARIDAELRPMSSRISAAICDARNLASGMIVCVETVPTITKQGFEFNRHAWFAHPEHGAKQWQEIQSRLAAQPTAPAPAAPAAPSPTFGAPPVANPFAPATPMPGFPWQGR